jgi:hypothetical protein
VKRSFQPDNGLVPPGSCRREEKQKRGSGLIVIKSFIRARRRFELHVKLEGFLKVVFDSRGMK